MRPTVCEGQALPPYCATEKCVDKLAEYIGEPYPASSRGL